MTTIQLARKARRARAAELRSTILHVIMATTFALVMVFIVTHPSAEPADSAIYSVAGP